MISEMQVGSLRAQCLERLKAIGGACLRIVEPDEEGQRWMDVRAQLVSTGESDGQERLALYVHWGDASYDQDHRGFWGAGVLSEADGEAELAELASDLIEQALDHKAQS